MSDLEELRATIGAARHAAFDRYVAEIAKREGVSVWSATHHVVEPALKIAGDDVAAFERILIGVAEVMARSPDDGRFEQQAVPVCSLEIALRGRPLAMLAILQGAKALAEHGVPPGWFVQLLVRPLARRGDGDFIAAWNSLIELAIGMAKHGQHPGYPIATGLAALVERGEPLNPWLELLAPLARAARDGVYGLFEYGITGLAQGGLDASDVGDALRLAIAMFDHDLQPGATLAALGTPLQLDLATKLAKAGVDPRLVITNGVAYFEQLGWLDDGGERLERIAIELHRRGLRQLLFEDGLDFLLALERHYDGIALRGLELIEAMIAKDLEPAIIFRWSMPRVLGFIRPTWAAAELLGFAERLVEHGIAPESAITWAARPLAEIATDAEDFRRLAGAVVMLVASLHSFGVDHREVLFHDVAQLAAAGNESQTFRELLEAFSGLLAAWTGDPTPLLKALPEAAREAVGRPWVLAIALTNATRLVRDGRAAEAVTLLEVGVKTATLLGTEGFEAALIAIEQRYAALPATLTSHASIAAGVIAGTDLGKLEAALQIIADASARHGAALDGATLPDLARIAGNELAGVIDVLVALHSPAAARIAAITAMNCRNDPATAQRVMIALGAWATTPERIATLDRFGGLARIVTPSGLVACVERVHAALADLPDRRVLIELLEHARTEPTLIQMCTLVPPLLREAQGPLVDGVRRARELVARNPLAWTYLVAPALVTAKQHAGALLSCLSWLPQRFVEREPDAEVIRDLITQRGVRAVDLISNLIAPALGRSVMPALANHRELLERYLGDVGFADADVYAHFVQIMAEGGDPARIAGLRAEIFELTAGIRAGELTAAQREHALFGVALQHVFPPSVTATREGWLRLVEIMPDRPEDVHALWPNGHDKPLEVAAGSWQLVVGDHDLSVFEWCARVLPGDVAVRPIAELGWELVTAWSEGRLAREPHKTELTRALLAHAENLPSPAFDSASQLQAIRALAADRLSNLVENAVVAARAEDDERVDRLVQTRLAPAPRIGPGLVKSLARTIDAVRAGSLLPAEAAVRLRGQLAMFELPEDPVGYFTAAPELAPAVHALPIKRTEIEAGKELGRIHADLVGQELAAMTAALDRALEYRASSQNVALDCTITKRALHAPIGLTAGVCVASDQQLWSTPGFMHLALWLDNVCVGSVHLLVVTERGERYLALPGINPSYALLDRVEPAVVLRALLDRVRVLAREAGLAGVWIPTSPGIHSNRHGIHDALRALKLTARRTEGHAFSYRPYAYRIDDVWQL